MRYLLIIIIICLLGCQSSSWSTKAQNEFNNDCIQAKQSVEVCNCLLSCLTEEYVDYNAAIHNMTSEQISTQLMQCIAQCE